MSEPTDAPASLEALLREQIAISKENNEILKDMRRIGRIAFWAKVVLWTILIILPLLLIGPILSGFSAMLAPGTASNVMGVPSPELIQQALDAYKGLSEQ